MKTEYVHPTRLSDEDLHLIAKGCLAVKVNTLDPKTLIEKALRREVFLYRIVGDGFYGIIALYLADECLWVEFVAGHGLVPHFEEIHEWLQHLALSCKVCKLSALISRPGLKRLWEKHEAKHAASYMTKEFRHG